MILLGPLIALVWHVNHQAWPNDDAANYLSTAYEQYLHFKNGTLGDGLAALYQVRGWRPILFPVLAVPFLWIFNGNVIAAVASVLLCAYVGWLVYFYRIARRYISSFRSAIAATIVGSLFPYYSFSTVFFSELTWLFFISGSVYHCLTSENFKGRYHALFAGVFLGLATLIRPAETVIIAVIPLALIVAETWRQQIVSTKDILTSGAIVGILCGILIVAAFVPAITFVVILLVGSTVIILAIFYVQRSVSVGATGLILFTVALCAVNTFWWANSMPALYSWVYETTFGPMAQITSDQSLSIGMGLTLLHIIQYYFSTQLVLILFAAILLVRPWRKQEKDKKSRKLMELALLSTGMLIPIFVAYMLTQTDDPRRPFVGMAFAILFLAVSALISGPLRRLRTASLGGLAVLQLLGFLSWAGEGVAVTNPTQQVENNVETINKIIDLGITPGSGVAVYTLSLFDSPNRIYEPAALTLASISLGAQIRIDYAWDIENYDEVLNELSDRGVQYLLLDSYVSSLAQQRPLPYVHFTSELLRRITEGGPQALQKLHLIGQFDLGNRHHWLFKIRNTPVLPGGILASSVVTAGASSEENGFPVSNLIDGSSNAWGSRSDPAVDIFTYLTLNNPAKITGVRVTAFSPGGRAHLRDIRVVATNNIPERTNAVWPKELCSVPIRLKEDKPFFERISLPVLPDNAFIDIELDQNSKCYQSYKIWGIVCLSKTQGDLCNYVNSNSMYVREIQLK